MTIFVGGVHAVGKTFLLKTTCEELAIKHATASQLIKEQRGLTNWTVSRQVNEIKQNQEALIAAVRRIKNGGEAIVLDGHFVLRREANVHEKINTKTFAELMIDGVILLEAPSTIIADRLLQRGDKTWTLKEIETFSQKEFEHAEAVCRTLNLPLVKLSMPSKLTLRNTIENLLADQ